LRSYTFSARRKEELKRLNKKHHVHSLIGGMTTDYFDIFCQNCDEIIEKLDFYGIDSVGVRLRAKCKKCGQESIFKLKTNPLLGPIEITDWYDKRGYKLYDGRKLKKHLREINHPSQLCKKENLKKRQ